MNKIYTYDLNTPSEMKGLIKYLVEDKNKQIISVDELSKIEKNAEGVLINPLPLYNEFHWKEIIYHVKENKNTMFLFFTPNLYEVQINGLLKGLTNTRSIFTREDMMHSRKNLDRLMEALQ